jgi:hypothetical protein
MSRQSNCVASVARREQASFDHTMDQHFLGTTRAIPPGDQKQGRGPSSVLLPVAWIVPITHYQAPLEPEQEDRRYRCHPSGALNQKNRYGVSRVPRQRTDREERDDWQLARHQQLPEVGFGAFVRLAGDTHRRDVADDDGKGTERHRERDERAGLPERHTRSGIRSSRHGARVTGRADRSSTDCQSLDDTRTSTGAERSMPRPPERASSRVWVLLSSNPLRRPSPVASAPPR